MLKLGVCPHMASVLFLHASPLLTKHLDWKLFSKPLMYVKRLFNLYVKFFSIPIERWELLV